MADLVKNLYREIGLGDILLIENDPWSRDSLSMFFGIVECRMLSVENAKEAITAVSRDRFDLILCEHQLSGMSGLTLLNILGNIQPGVVRFLFTSYPIQKLADEAARYGIHEVIRKPFAMATLEESLKRYFPRVRNGSPDRFETQ